MASSISYTLYSYGDDQDGSRGVHSYPLDYINSGRYDWTTGLLYYQGPDVYMWASTIYDNLNSYRMRSWFTLVQTAAEGHKAVGNVIRCGRSINIHFIPVQLWR